MSMKTKEDRLSPKSLVVSRLPFGVCRKQTEDTFAASGYAKRDVPRKLMHNARTKMIRNN